VVHQEVINVNHFLASLALIGASLLFASSAIAQDGNDKSAAGDKSTVTVTVCLAQGDQTNEYSIRDANGKTYGLMSSSVNLKPHLGHQVSITGTPMKEKGTSTESKTGKSEESEHLRVTDLKMISSSCQQ